jgi:hypothetical protein
MFDLSAEKIEAEIITNLALLTTEELVDCGFAFKELSKKFAALRFKTEKVIKIRIEKEEGPLVQDMTIVGNRSKVKISPRVRRKYNQEAIEAFRESAPEDFFNCFFSQNWIPVKNEILAVKDYNSSTSIDFLDKIKSTFTESKIKPLFKYKMLTEADSSD